MPKEAKEHRQRPEKRENEKIKRKLEKEAKEKIHGTKQERLLSEKKAEKKGMGTFHQTKANREKIERDNKAKTKAKQENTKNTFKVRPTHYTFHGDNGLRIDARIVNQGHIPRSWAIRENVGKFFWRSNIIGVELEGAPDTRNSILVPETDAKGMSIGNAIKLCVRETVRSGHEVGFVYDTSTRRVYSSIIEGEEKHLTLNDEVINAARELRQAGKLGSFHTHPLEPKEEREKDTPSFASTLSPGDYDAITDGGSNELMVAVPHPEKGHEGRYVAKTYTFLMSPGTNDDQVLLDELKTISKGERQKLDKPSLRGMYEFFHRMGGRYERVKIDRVPALARKSEIADRAERDKVHRS